MKFYETPKFLALNKRWQKKLEKGGFDDKEQEDGNLKIWSSYYFKVRYNPTLYQAKEEYYRQAGRFLEEHAFKVKAERIIWELHSQGISLVEIHREIRRRNFKVPYSRVVKIVAALRDLMRSRNGQV